MPSPQPAQERDRTSLDDARPQPHSHPQSAANGKDPAPTAPRPQETAVNGHGHAHKPAPQPASASPSLTASSSARQSLDDIPPSAVSLLATAGKRSSTPLPDGNGEVQALEDALRKEREEKEQLAAQYHSLVDKLQHMRTSLGNKLKQDAEELDRREQAINQLTERAENQQAEISTLNFELQDVQDRSATLSSELALLRSRTSQLDQLEQELQSLRSEREKDRLVREEENREWERERMGWEREREGWEETERAWERERREADAWKERWEDEKGRAGNLEGVLEDFMAAKESEMRVATAELSSQLSSVSSSLAEYKARTQKAEAALAQSANSSTRCAELEKEVKEKNLLIGKLRHEAVIINEHLTEALRRLRKSNSENNVDRRLITNTLLAFLSTPRADSKRFEMLTLLSSVLGWNDDERAKAGLQRATPTTARRVPSSSRTTASEGGAPTPNETESFSKMWVEFLLKESSQPLSPPSTTASLPGMSPVSYSPSPTPTVSSFSGLLSPSSSIFTPLPSVNEANAGNPFFPTAPGPGALGLGPAPPNVRSPPVGTVSLPRISSWSSQNGSSERKL
ncbi:hypothetical protein CALVIDRAFT_599214 [Calocera viscosa TUFC12733]|uniref:GRIP domain-containing protein n=1 Tax=Calocera viscosa (strain TUFC12733) TaxID=1330018 RepID=A0A167L876_CALVF|nr:hypothetical protein CALVIDRAFT_599214 [Calocera viscosa TUFC12733]